jgi:hypothetical protein
MTLKLEQERYLVNLTEIYALAEENVTPEHNKM